jgi:hypothetical protein
VDLTDNIKGPQTASEIRFWEKQILLHIAHNIQCVTTGITRYATSLNNDKLLVISPQSAAVFVHIREEFSERIASARHAFSSMERIATMVSQSRVWRCNAAGRKAIVDRYGLYPP